MSYFADFDRYAIGERNRETRREVLTLRLEKRLREGSEPLPGARPASFDSKSTRPLPGRAG